MLKKIEKILLGFSITLAIEMIYQYGRYSAIHEVYKRGWTIQTEQKNENQLKTQSKKTES